MPTLASLQEAVNQTQSAFNQARNALCVWHNSTGKDSLGKCRTNNTLTTAGSCDAAINGGIYASGCKKHTGSWADCKWLGTCNDRKVTYNSLLDAAIEAKEVFNEAQQELTDFSVQVDDELNENGGGQTEEEKVEEEQSAQLTSYLIFGGIVLVVIVVIIVGIMLAIKALARTKK